MIVVGCVKINRVIALIDGLVFNEIRYQLVKVKGIQAFFKHDGVNDDEAALNAEWYIDQTGILEGYIIQCWPVLMAELLE